MHDVGMQDAEGGEGAGIRREDHLADAQFLRHGDGVQPARAAEGKQAEVAWVEPLLEEAEPRRRGQGVVDHGQHPFRRRIRFQPQGLRHPGGDGLAGAFGVQRHGAAQEEAPVQPAEGDVHIRHRRLGAAPAVADGAREGARRARPDGEPPAGIHRREGAAAGADGADLDHRQAHRQAVDLALGHQRDLAALHHADVEGGAAHVGADEVRPAQRLGGAHGGERPAAGAGQEQPHRLPRRHPGGADAAIGLHQQQPRRQRTFLHALLQAGEVAPHHRHQQCIQHGGRAALVFADLRTHLGGQAERQVRELGADAPGQQRLMRRVDMGVEQADRHRLGLQRTQPLQHRRHRGLVQRRLHAAVAAQPFRHAEAPVARHQRGLHLLLQPVDVAAGVAADLQHVLEARRGQQHAAREAPLQHRVGGDGGAVQQQADVGEGEAVAFRRRLDACHQADGGVLRRGRGLEAVQPAAPLVEDLQVGEGASDIDADPDMALGGQERDPDHMPR